MKTVRSNRFAAGCGTTAH
ncbi:rCG61619 [Rattus norvegicus]|uniref:RCG61619 n=1 Tax=Rattus norvegicus TaxID=10116 RepID=A6H9T6_RAT|nr:rCG61619 [Rattus norvegicus]